jgi:hypothetical protein
MTLQEAVTAQRQREIARLRKSAARIDRNAEAMAREGYDAESVRLELDRAQTLRERALAIR